MIVGTMYSESPADSRFNIHRGDLIGDQRILRVGPLSEDKRNGRWIMSRTLSRVCALAVGRPAARAVFTREAAYNVVMRLTILFLFAAGLIFGQSTPVDCTPSSTTFTAATTGAAISNANTATPCVAWRLTYNSTGFSALSIQLETSPDNSSWTAVTNSVCSSTTQPPCVIDGANPSTTTGNATLSVRAYGRYVRVNVTSVTGSGSIVTRLYGYKGLSAAAAPPGGGGGGGGGGTTVTFSLPYIQFNSNSYGPVWQLTPPPTSSWTQVNFGTSAVTQTAGGALSVSWQTVGNTDATRGYVRAKPGSTYTIVIQCVNVNFSCGIMLYDTVSTKATTYFMNQGGIFGFNWSDPATFTSRVFSDISNVTGAQNPSTFFLKVQDNGTNEIFSISPDNVSFSQISSRTSGTFLTATSIGITPGDLANTNGKSYGAILFVPHFALSTP